MAFKKFDIPGIGPVTVYKRRDSRSLRLKVSGGDVLVTIPAWGTYKTGVDFARARQAWIAVQRPLTPQALYDGIAVGKTRSLRFLASPIAAVRTRVLAEKVLISHPLRLSSDSPAVQEAARTACYRALKAETETLIIPRMGDLAYEHGFSYKSAGVKRLASRWGSCDSRQNITLNLFLTQLPWPLIDYVLLHELVHTRVLNHGPDFWHLFESVLPGARGMRKQLRAYRPELTIA